MKKQKQVTSRMGTTREVAANAIRSGIGALEEIEHASTAFLAKNNEEGKRDPKKLKSNRFCSHCQRSGHTVYQCFNIIGYPDWCEGPKDSSARTRRLGVKVAANQDSHLDEERGT